MAGFRSDSLITAAARAIVRGDPLGALKRVALRHDAPALALRDRDEFIRSAETALQRRFAVGQASALLVCRIQELLCMRGIGQEGRIDGQTAHTLSSGGEDRVGNCRS